MNRVVYSIVLSAIAIALMGCQSHNETSVSANGQKDVTNTAGKGSFTNSQNINANPQSSTETSSSANSANPSGSTDELRSRRLGQVRGPTASQDSRVAAGQPFSHPAPDNSVYTVALADKAVETRVFNDHPQLLKVEKVSDGTQSNIKVFLRDGRVLELQGEKIITLSTISAADILHAAGVPHSPGPERKLKPAKPTQSNP